jgi:hypothetical protein
MKELILLLILGAAIVAIAAMLSTVVSYYI